MQSISQLYEVAFNASGPVFLLIIVGITFHLANLTPKQTFRQINFIAFKFSLPISLIYTIGKISFNRQKLMIVASTVIITLIGIIITIPLCLLYKKEERVKAFSNLISISSMNTAVLCGLPIVQGLFEVNDLEQYAFIQLVVTFIIVIPLMYFTFELDIHGKTGIKNAIFITIKQPIPISIFLGIIYNLLGLKINFIRNQPIYLELFFVYFKRIFVSLGLLCLGMFATDQVRTKHKRIQTTVTIQIFTFIITNIYRCLLLPIIFSYINLYFKIPKILAEINAILYMTPAAVLGYSICDEYDFGAIWPGIQSVFGIILTSLFIPVLQIFVEFIYGDTDFPIIN